jgi:hypothetical protein
MHLGKPKIVFLRSFLALIIISGHVYKCVRVCSCARVFVHVRVGMHHDDARVVHL